MKIFLIDRIKNLSITLFTFQLLLCVIGGLVVFSTTYSDDTPFSQIFINQVLFYLAGIFISIFLAGFDYRFISRKSVVALIFLLTLVFLILVLLYGEVIFGTKRWLSFLGFTIQPSEFAKLCVTILVGFAFSSKTFSETKDVIDLRKDTRHKSKIELVSGLLKNISISRHTIIFFLTLTIIILVLLQKSLGNTLLILGIYLLLYLSILKISSKNILYIFSAFLGVLISFRFVDLSEFYLDLKIDAYFFDLDMLQIFLAIVMLYFVSIFSQTKFRIYLFLFILFLFSSFFLNFSYNNLLQDYQRGRIESFLNPQEGNALSDDWNKIQSQTAIGSGQIFGKGFMKGTQVTFGLLPFPHTDFVYAAFAEQFGFVGSVVLIVIYLFLLFKILIVGKNAEDDFGKILCLGVFLMIILNMFQSIGMNIGILPISGVPLPLISYGGSAVLAISVGLGLVQSVNSISKERSGVVVKVEVD